MSNTHAMLLKDTVQPEWVDYNGHMNDAAYAKVFSMAVDNFIEKLGLDAETREKLGYSIYTLETHLCYLKEAHEGQSLSVTVQLLDHDAKRLHLFFVMENDDGEHLATSEQMLMGMDKDSGRPAVFPSPIMDQVSNLAEADRMRTKPDKAGRQIGIRKHS